MSRFVLLRDDEPVREGERLSYLGESGRDEDRIYGTVIRETVVLKQQFVVIQREKDSSTVLIRKTLLSRGQ